MSTFKVGDVCIYKPRNGEASNENFGKIFTLLSFQADSLNKLDGSKFWDTDTEFLYMNAFKTVSKHLSVIPESYMRKLDNPDDNSVDEMIEIVGKALTVKEYELEI